MPGITEEEEEKWAVIDRGFLTENKPLPCLDSWGESLDKGDVVGLALR